jgi:hypothetical protein
MNKRFIPMSQNMRVYLLSKRKQQAFEQDLLEMQEKMQVKLKKENTEKRKKKIIKPNSERNLHTKFGVRF